MSQWFRVKQAARRYNLFMYIPFLSDMYYFKLNLVLLTNLREPFHSLLRSILTHMVTHYTYLDQLTNLYYLCA